MLKMPLIASLLTNKYNAWVVGSAANPENSDPRDWDIIVPYNEWNKACSLIPKDAKVNSFGGFKFDDKIPYTEETRSVDVWPANLNDLATHSMFTYAWQPATGTLLKKEYRKL